MIKSLVEIYHDDSERLSLEQYNREQEASEAQIERGEFLTQLQVRQAIEEWDKQMYGLPCIGSTYQCEKNNTHR